MGVEAEPGTAGETTQGLDALLEGALTDVRDRRLREAAERLVAAERAIAALDLPASDPRRGAYGAMWGHVLRLTGRADEATAVLIGVVDASLRYEWWPSGSRAAVQLGWLTRAANDTAAAERWMREAARLADLAGPADVVGAYCALADLLSLHGDRSGAERALAVAVEQAHGDDLRFRMEITRAMLADRHGRPDEADRALRTARRLAPAGTAAYEVALQQAKMALARGEDADALKHARRAAKLATDWGSTLIQAGARMLVGEVARSLGRLDEAERAYTTAEALYGGQLSARIARLNRALVDVERGRYDDANALAAPLRHTFTGSPIAEAVVLLCVLPAAAARGDTAAVGSAISEVQARVTTSGIVHRDLASLATIASDRLVHHGEHELAIRITALAHDQWRRLGNNDQLTRAAARLRDLRLAGAPIPLRGFLLDAVIGEGASGTVWRGRHAATGEKVAIKVLRGGPAVTSTVRSMFARELRAVAGLDHPNVVWLIDHGWVDDGAAIVDGRLEIDAPFLALEYAAEGTLDPRCGRTRWAECLSFTLAILDALAHAHARGLLHLDLKPTNILLAGTPDARTPKLADFGLARAPAPGRQLRATGTPAYMAPEQFGQDAGALGPWTDLYALGCVLTAMLTGGPPFGLRGAAQLRDAHLHRPPPPLAAPVPVPDGLAAIVDKLLAKSIHLRYRSAAEVARALSALPPVEDDADPRLASARPAPRGPYAAATTVLLPVLDLPVDDSDVGVPSDEDPSTRAFPSRWDERAPEPRANGLVAAGLGLVSLRRPRTVGRGPERSELWNALRSVVEKDTGASLLVVAEPSAGARHLVRWLAERGHELGAARGLMVTPETGLPGGLSAAVAAVDADRGNDAVRIELERLAGSRPLVVGLLRADRCAGAAQVLAAATRCNAPVLCVGTVPTPVPEAFGGLGAGTMHLRPASDALLAEMIRSLLPLSDAVVDAICARAGGSPGAVMQMVRRLAADRQLVPSDGGWTLRPSADLDAVLDPGRPSRPRLDALGVQERRAIDVLRDRGGPTPLEAWADACRTAGVTEPEATLERLARSGWVEPNSGGVWLTDSVVDALSASAAAGGLPRRVA